MPSRLPRRWSWWALVLLSLVLGAACAGCKTHLVGLGDLWIHYRVTGVLPPAEELDSRIALRLAAADLAADIDADQAGQVSVRVDEEFASETGRLLTWQGGLRLTVTDEIAREGDAPLAEIDTEAAVADGPRVVVPLAADAEAALLALGARQPVPIVSVMRDRTVLAALPADKLLDDHRLVLSLGASIVAYTEAADLAHLLATPKLPPLVETSRSALPPDWLLAGANLVLPFVVSFAWLFFVRRFDRAQPEPMWLVVMTFALGALAVVPAGIAEWGWDTLSPYTNPTLLTFGRSMRAFPVALLGFIVTVGVTEEGAKLLATWSLATHRREFDEPVDGMVYGAAAALGFAAAENVRYLALGRVAGALVASRAFMSVPAHLFFGTIWGYALGRRLVEPARRVWPLFLAAVTLHGLFDTLLSIDGGAPWAVLVELFVASIFVVQLRLALRHGAVTPADALPPEARGRRELFRMGSRRAFAAFVIAMYVFSIIVFLLTLLDHSGRAWITFGVASAIALGLLGWAARGVAATLPLDVVVDDTGVTFAGAAILYRDVVRIERQKLLGSPHRQEQMLIIGETRRLTLGPASKSTIDALSHALAMRLSSVALRS